MTAGSTFVAIDFETADRGRDSACSIGLVRVEGDAVVAREYRLIRPPRKIFENTRLHGIAWRHVQDKPLFAEVWRELEPLTRRAKFFAAHDASIDRAVLECCCSAAGIIAPRLRFECTVGLARRTWGLFPTTLADVCEYLGITFERKAPMGDVDACASIVLAARKFRSPEARV